MHVLAHAGLATLELLAVLLATAVVALAIVRERRRAEAGEPVRPTAPSRAESQENP